MLLAIFCVPAAAQKKMSRDQALAVINRELSGLKGLKDTELGDVYVDSSIGVHGTGLRYTLVIFPAGEKAQSTITEDFDLAQISDVKIFEPEGDNPVGSVALFFRDKVVISNKVAPKALVAVDFPKGDGKVGMRIEEAVKRLCEIYIAGKIR
jgi:hypothetical protein